MQNFLGQLPSELIWCGAFGNRIAMHISECVRDGDTGGTNVVGSGYI
jgi:hypothetical protein